MKLFTCVVVALALVPLPARAQQKSPGAGPVVVIETAKGTIEIETYPEDAPKTVGNFLALVKRGFYNGLRFHRAEANFLIQAGDPQSRDMTKQAGWGTSSSGKPIGVAEISKKHRNVAGAVGMGHTGDAKGASSHFYILLRAAPSLDGRYSIFGRVIKGMDVVAKIQKADVIKRVSVKE